MTKGNLNNLDKSFVQNLSNNWALVTSGASDNYNMMTVNWGGIGFLWNKPVLFIFIRPERYTFEFIEKYRSGDKSTLLIVVPTSFNSVTEDEFKRRGVNVVIYANQLTRSGFPAMQNAAKTILTHQRAFECDSQLMSIKEIINLIPEEV